MRTAVLTMLCKLIFAITGHRICCRIPGWLAGPRWEPVDVKPWNPYNMVWSFGQWVLRYADGPLEKRVDDRLDE